MSVTEEDSPPPVELTPVLQLLCEQAQHDIEYKASLFWQAFLQHAFPLGENYIVGCEQAPDRQASRARADIVVLRYDPSHHTLSSMIIMEAKRQGTPQLKELETQARRGALAAIEEEKLTAIYAMTTWGTRFRLWVVDYGNRNLVPLHGYDSRGSREDYIDVRSPKSGVLNQAIKFIKGEPPIRNPSIVPSQIGLQPAVFGQASLGAFSPSGRFDADPATSAEVSNTYGFQTTEAGPSRPSQGQHQASHIPDAETEEADVVGPSAGTSAGGTKANPWKEVQISVFSHALRNDEWGFQDAHGHAVVTKRTDWKERKHVDGQRVWAFKRKGGDMRYFTRQNLLNL